MYTTSYSFIYSLANDKYQLDKSKTTTEVEYLMENMSDRLARLPHITQSIISENNVSRLLY